LPIGLFIAGIVIGFVINEANIKKQKIAFNKKFKKQKTDITKIVETESKNSVDSMKEHFNQLMNIFENFPKLPEKDQTELREYITKEIARRLNLPKAVVMMIATALFRTVSESVSIPEGAVVKLGKGEENKEEENKD